ncbi:hypothetical protein Y695_04139 [Hydrogenophaga sp. T4]|nr:hypothetical protein Y695_04139 [Hydrogenophaga sp. T4]
MEASAWMLTEPPAPSGEATRRSWPRFSVSAKLFCS